MALVATSSDYGGTIRVVMCDEVGSFIYVGGDSGMWTGDTWLQKLQTSDLAFILSCPTWYGLNILALTQDSNFVYMGGSTANKVWKLRKSDLVKTIESANYG